MGTPWEHLENLMGTPWELDGNTIENKKSIPKRPYSPMFQGKDV
jgi:hypothetical protein